MQVHVRVGNCAVLGPDDLQAAFLRPPAAIAADGAVIYQSKINDIMTRNKGGVSSGVKRGSTGRCELSSVELLFSLFLRVFGLHVLTEAFHAVDILLKPSH